ncbi:MAG: hypothetical protein V1720_04440 [bacterium]
MILFPFRRYTLFSNKSEKEVRSLLNENIDTNYVGDKDNQFFGSHSNNNFYIIRKNTRSTFSVNGEYKGMDNGTMIFIKLSNSKSSNIGIVVFLFLIFCTGLLSLDSEFSSQKVVNILLVIAVFSFFLGILTKIMFKLEEKKTLHLFKELFEFVIVDENNKYQK